MKLFVLIALAACGGNIPQTRYYQLATPASATTPAHGERVLVVESLATEGAYDDERIVYRADPYRLDYYQYHHWSSTPGVMIGGFLRQALARTGAFRAVLREAAPDASLVLGGRIVAIEEIDQSKTQWLGRIAIELTLSDPKTGEIVWTQPFDESEPLTAQTPEGLATGLSVAMSRIVALAAPTIAEVAARRDTVAGTPIRP
jgi:ABC-type uncharacterized transport system auxiliary subunit